MSDLSEFLLARIAEDEAVANRSVSHGTGGFATPYWQRLWNGPGQHPVMAAQRLLAECAAKRRIVVRCEEMLSAAVPMAVHLAKQTLADLGRSYTDHPDYRAEWRPA